MKKKTLFVAIPTILMTSVMVSCKGGDTPTPKPTEDVLESISASPKATFYFTDDTFNKSDLLVIGTYSISGNKTISENDFAVDVPLPYTFTDDDVANGKTFTVSFSGKTATAVATVKEYNLKNINWCASAVYNNKTLYELAKGADEIYFGKKSDYESQLAGLASFAVDENNKGKIKGYFPTHAPETIALYILTDSDKHGIQFEDNDRIKIDSNTFGPFAKLTKTSKITFDKKMRFDFKNYASFFEGSSALTEIKGLDYFPFDVSAATNMERMFAGCSALTTIDASFFSTDNVLNFNSMFEGCTQLKTIYATKDFKVSESATSDNMFKDCSSLVGGNATPYSADHINGEYARIDVEGTPGYFSLKPLN